MAVKIDNYDIDQINWKHLVEEADELLEKLFPICRSLTGDGVRETLSLLQKITGFEIKEVLSGTKCFDWTVPDEWNIKDGWIKNSAGDKIVDFRKSNIHVMNYSVPVDKVISFDELKGHLHYLTEIPSAIPYRTTYYNQNWGFCISYNQYKNLNQNEKYHIYIDSELEPGSLSYGEFNIKGAIENEYLVSTYCCHPSLANDNLSGVVLWILLLRELKKMHTRNSYRFIIVPETIGAIAYLSLNEEIMKNLNGGFVITTVAGPGQFGYKRTFLGDHLIDRIVQKTYRELRCDYISYPFSVMGSDETQFSAPHFRIPVGTICKDKYYEYKYYHTSLDNLDYINAENLINTLKIYLLSIEKLEHNVYYKSLCPFCEPMLGKRGLYPNVGGSINQKATNMKIKNSERHYQISNEKSISGNELEAIYWIMFYCDGNYSIMDIAEKTDLPVKQLHLIAKKLCENGLLSQID